MNDEVSASRPGGSPPLRAHTFNEVRYYLMVTSCRACGKGPWEIGSAETPSPPDQISYLIGVFLLICTNKYITIQIFIKILQGAGGDILECSHNRHSLTK